MLFKSGSHAHVSTDARHCQGRAAAPACSCCCMCHPVLRISGEGKDLGLGLGLERRPRRSIRGTVVEAAALSVPAGTEAAAAPRPRSHWLCFCCHEDSRQWSWWWSAQICRGLSLCCVLIFYGLIKSVWPEQTRLAGSRASHQILCSWLFW